MEAEECETTDHAYTDGSVVEIATSSFPLRADAEASQRGGGKGIDSGGKNGGAGPMKAGANKGPVHHSLMAAACASASLNNTPRQAFLSEVASCTT